jgi:hypothetical protein
MVEENKIVMKCYMKIMEMKVIKRIRFNGSGH